MRVLPLVLLALGSSAVTLAAQEPTERAGVRVLGAIPARVDAWSVAPALVGRRIYYTVHGDTLYVLDTTTGESTRVAAGVMREPTVSPAGDRLVFLRDDEAGTSRDVWTLPLDPATGLAAAPARRVTVNGARLPAVSPDGRWIAFAAPGPGGANVARLAVVPVNGGSERMVTDSVRYLSAIAWSADGRELELLMGSDSANVHRGRLFRVPGSGGTPRFIRYQSWGYTSPGDSPDGAYAAYYSADPAGNDDLVVADAAGRTLARLRGRERFAYPEKWLTDSTLLEVARPDTQTYHLVTRGTGRTRDLSLPLRMVRSFRWAPNGRQLAACGGVGGTPGVAFVAPDGSNPRVVTLPAGAACTTTAWSPDARWYAVANRGFITVINAETGALQRLAASGDPQSLRWTRDSRAVRYTVAPVADAGGYRAGSQVIVRQAALAGGDAHVATLERGQGAGRQVFLTDSTLVVGSYLVWLSSGRDRVLTDGRLVESDEGNYLLALSPRPAAGRPRLLKLLDLEGTVRDTLSVAELPRSPAPIGRLTSDGRFYLEAFDNGGDRPRLAQIDVATGRTTALVNLPNGSLITAIATSPDGEQVAYVSLQQQTTIFRAVDVSALVRAAASR